MRVVCGNYRVRLRDGWVSVIGWEWIWFWSAKVGTFAWTTNHKDSAISFCYSPLVHFRISTWISGWQLQVWCGWCLAGQGRCLLATTGLPSRGVGIMTWGILWTYGILRTYASKPTCTCSIHWKPLCFFSRRKLDAPTRDTNQESRKQALQLTISKMGSAFERARLCNDVPCMKQIKEMRPVLSKAVTTSTSMFSNFLYCSLSLSLCRNIYWNTYVYILDWFRSYFTSTNCTNAYFFVHNSPLVWSSPLQSVLFWNSLFPERHSTQKGVIRDIHPAKIVDCFGGVCFISGFPTDKEQLISLQGHGPEAQWGIQEY